MGPPSYEFLDTRLRTCETLLRNKAAKYPKVLKTIFNMFTLYFYIYILFYQSVNIMRKYLQGRFQEFPKGWGRGGWTYIFDLRKSMKKMCFYTKNMGITH